MEEMPELHIEVLTVTLDRMSGHVAVDYAGMNYLEAIGVLTVALNLIQDVPFEMEMEADDGED